MIFSDIRLRRPTAFFIPALAFFLMSCTAVLAQEEPRMAGDVPEYKHDESETYRQLNLFGDVFERVQTQYVDEVEEKELIENAINGMLTALDPHSSYLNEDSYKEMQIDTRGEFGGLGIEVTMENGFVKVVSPIDDTPAYRAGVEAGDYITHLDGKPILGMTLSEAVDQMRGRVGTEIEITVRREGEPEALEFKIVRDVIRIRSVRSKTLEDSIGYLRITQFNQNTASGMKDTFKSIRSELGDKLIGFVLDLRNNPGGLLDQAIAVSDLFLDQGEIVSTRGRNEQDTKRDHATRGDMADGLPVIVLINGGSASASEIVAGALQDHRRAIVLGTPSFGKGSVQTVIPLPGHGAMRLTTARYYTPSGRSIQAKGIEPDILVEPAKIESFKVSRMRESDLRGALDSEDVPDEIKDVLKEQQKALKDQEPQKNNIDNGNEDDANAKNEDEDDPLARDYQLLRAVDLIRGVSMYGMAPHLSAQSTDAEQKGADGKDENTVIEIQD